jgi:hypothetical protein
MFSQSADACQANEDGLVDKVIEGTPHAIHMIRLLGLTELEQLDFHQYGTDVNLTSTLTKQDPRHKKQGREKTGHTRLLQKLRKSV